MRPVYVKVVKGSRSTRCITIARVVAESAGPAEVIERLRDAMNAHDLEGLLECIDPEYVSEQPAHPNRRFSGREQVRGNWSAMFAGIGDFTAELLDMAVSGETAWTEWSWSGTRADGTQLAVRGVTVFRVVEGRIASGRLYMEDVEGAGDDIDASVRHLAGRDPDRS
jgi:ketosteroid isomerase-like protein